MEVDADRQLKQIPRKQRAVLRKAMTVEGIDLDARRGSKGSLRALRPQRAQPGHTCLSPMLFSQPESRSLAMRAKF